MELITERHLRKTFLSTTSFVFYMLFGTFGGSPTSEPLFKIYVALFKTCLKTSLKQELIKANILKDCFVVLFQIPKAAGSGKFVFLQDLSEVQKASQYLPSNCSHR